MAFAYFTEILNLNISQTNADIYKRQTAFLFRVYEVLYDTLRKSRGKILIIVSL